MKPDRRASTAPGNRIGPYASAPPARYDEIAKQHIEANGGDGVVLERDKRDHRQQWRAWIAYFAWLDGLSFPPGRKAVTFAGLAKITVPAAWPTEFDASAPPRPPPEPMWTEDDVTPSRRRELAAMLFRTVAGITLLGERKTPPPDARYASALEVRAQAAAHHEARLAELADAPWPTPSPVLDKYLDAMRPPGHTPPPSDERAWPQAEDDGDDAAAAW